MGIFEKWRKHDKPNANTLVELANWFNSFTICLHLTTKHTRIYYYTYIQLLKYILATPLEKPLGALEGWGGLNVHRQLLILVNKKENNSFSGGYIFQLPFTKIVINHS